MTQEILKVDCEGCGQYHEMPRGQIRLRLCPKDMPRSHYTFHCPVLDRRVTTPACAHVLPMFAAIRMPFDTFEVPGEVLEREAHGAGLAPLSEDDLITLGLNLARLDTTKEL